MRTVAAAVSNTQHRDGVYNKYSQWDCGKRDPAGSVLPCVGLCLGTAVLDTDLVTLTSDLLAAADSEAAAATSPPLVSKIHDVRLLNPATGADLTNQIQVRGRCRKIFVLFRTKNIPYSQSEKLEEPMRLQINIENSTRRAGYQFKCHVFVSGAWSAAPCNTTSLSVAPDSSVSANCDCSVSKNIYNEDLKIFEPYIQLCPGARLHRGVPHPRQRAAHADAERARAEHHRQIQVSSTSFMTMTIFIIYLCAQHQGGLLQGGGAQQGRLRGEPPPAAGQPPEHARHADTEPEDLARQHRGHTTHPEILCLIVMERT